MAERTFPTAPSPIGSGFISSVSSGFEDVRGHVGRGVESIGIEAVMFENRPAADAPSRETLFEHIAKSDVFLLVLGSRYGERLESGMSATEEEFQEAERLGKPVLVLLLAGDRDPEQQQFVRRVRGSWTVGHFVPQFQEPDEAGYAAIRALRWLRESQAPLVDLTQPALDAIETYVLLADRPLQAFAKQAIELARGAGAADNVEWVAAVPFLFEHDPHAFYALFHLLYDQAAELGTAQMQATAVVAMVPELRAYANHFAQAHALLTEAADCGKSISFFASVLRDPSARAEHPAAVELAIEQRDRITAALDERQHVMHDLMFDLEALRRGSSDPAPEQSEP